MFWSEALFTQHKNHSGVIFTQPTERSNFLPNNRSVSYRVALVWYERKLYPIWKSRRSDIYPLYCERGLLHAEKQFVSPFSYSVDECSFTSKPITYNVILVQFASYSCSLQSPPYYFCAIMGVHILFFRMESQWNLKLLWGKGTGRISIFHTLKVSVKAYFPNAQNLI